MLRLSSLLNDLDLRGSRMGGLGAIVENSVGGSTSSSASVFTLGVILPVLECTLLVVAMGVGVSVITGVAEVSVVTGVAEVSVVTGVVEVSVVTGVVEVSVVTGVVEVSVFTGGVEVSVVTGGVEVSVVTGVVEVSLSLYSDGGGIASG